MELGTSNREPEKFSSNKPNWVLIFLFYSYYILEVPFLGSPFQSLQGKCTRKIPTCALIFPIYSYPEEQVRYGWLSKLWSPFVSLV